MACVIISAGVADRQNTWDADNLDYISSARVSAFHTRNAVLVFSVFGLFLMLLDTILHVSRLILRLPPAFDVTVSQSKNIFCIENLFLLLDASLLLSCWFLLWSIWFSGKLVTRIGLFWCENSFEIDVVQQHGKRKCATWRKRTIHTYAKVLLHLPQYVVDVTRTSPRLSSNFFFSFSYSSQWSSLSLILPYDYYTDHHKVLLRNHLLSAVLEIEKKTHDCFQSPINLFYLRCKYIWFFCYFLFRFLVSFLLNSICFSSSAIINRNAHDPHWNADTPSRI